MEKGSKSLGPTLKQAVTCLVIQATDGKIHRCGPWQVGKNRCTKKLFLWPASIECTLTF